MNAIIFIDVKLFVGRGKRDKKKINASVVVVVVVVACLEGVLLSRRGSRTASGQQQQLGSVSAIGYIVSAVACTTQRAPRLSFAVRVASLRLSNIESAIYVPIGYTHTRLGQLSSCNNQLPHTDTTGEIRLIFYVRAVTRYINASIQSWQCS